MPQRLKFTSKSLETFATKMLELTTLSMRGLNNYVLMKNYAEKR